MKHFIISLSIFCIFSNYTFTQNSPEYFLELYKASSHDIERLNALDSLLFHKQWTGSASEISDYTEIFIELALTHKKYDRAIESAIRAFYPMNAELGQRERSLAMLENMETYLDKTNDSYLKGGIYVKKGGAYFNGKNFKKAVENYQKSIDFYSNKDSIYKADAIYFKGQAHFELGEYLAALNDFQLASTYYENLKELNYLFYTLSSKINIYGANGFHEKTIEEREKLIQKRIDYNMPTGLSTDYYNQSLNYAKLNKLKLQETSLLQSIKYLDKATDNKPYMTVVAYCAIAKLKLDQNKLDEANNYLKKVEEVIKTHPDQTYSKIYYQYTRSYFYYKTKRFSDAKSLALETLKKVEAWGKSSVKIKLNQLLYKINHDAKNYQEAIHYLETSTRLNDSIFNIEKTNALSFYQTQYETEQKEKEIIQQKSDIELLEKDQEINDARNNILILLLLATLTITSFIIYVIRLRSKKLKRKLEYRKNELNLFTKKLVDKGKEFELLNDELDKLKKVEIQEIKLEKLQELTSSKILTPSDWTEFKERFSKVYPNFFAKARATNIDLTNAEERLFALERLNLKTQEIANILGVSSESVVKNRYRLKKKLGISKQVSLIEYLEAS